MGTAKTPDTFAATLRALMEKNRLSASALARKVWGTVKDSRGYDVARNRDRVGHYLSGKSFPEKETMVKIAGALGVPVDVLEKTRPAPFLRDARDLRDVRAMLYTGERFGWGNLSMNRVELTSKTILRIITLVEEDRHRAKAK